MASSEQPLAVSGSLADAEAAMHKGRGRSLLVFAALAIALAGGLVFLVGGEDQARVYGEIGRKINGLERGNFDQFWGCALPGDNVNDIRDKCMPKLQDIGPQLDTLIVPEDLKHDVKAMQEANGALRSAWSGFVAYLDDPELSYDEDVAKRHLQGIARGWYEFRKAHADVNKAIKSKLK